VTIKIKSVKVRLWDDDYRNDKPYLAVLVSDWRKLMRLVKALEGNAIGRTAMNEVYDALEALEKKK